MPTNLIHFALGPSGLNLLLAKEIKGITSIDVAEEINTFNIVGDNEDCVRRASMAIAIHKEFLLIPKKVIAKVIGRNHRTIVGLRHISGALEINVVEVSCY